MNKLLTGLEDKTEDWKKGIALYKKEKSRVAWKKPPRINVITHHDIQTKEHQYNPILHQYSSEKKEIEAKAREHAISLNIKRSHIASVSHQVSNVFPQTTSIIKKPIPRTKKLPSIQNSTSGAAPYVEDSPLRRFNPLKIQNPEIRFIDNGILVTNIVECKTPPAPFYDEVEEEKKNEPPPFNKGLYNESSGESDNEAVGALPNITNKLPSVQQKNKNSSGQKNVQEPSAIKVNNASEVSKLLSENRIARPEPMSKESNPFCINKSRMISKNRKIIRTGGFKK